MPAKLRAAFLEAVESGRVRTMQNKSMPAAPLHRAGALLLGDAFNMRHPLTGTADARLSVKVHPERLTLTPWACCLCERWTRPRLAQAHC